MNSVTPPTKYLTFGPWIYLVPQYKPKNVLMLGFAGGTAAGLIRLLYGDIPITAVDIEPCEKVYGIVPIQEDAEYYIQTCPEFDCIIVDIYGEKEIPSFVFTKKFAENLEKKGKYIILYGENLSDVSMYSNFQLISSIQIIANRVFYFKNKKHELPELTIPI